MKMARLIAGWMLLTAGLILLTGCHRFFIPANTPAATIALKSAHDRYVTALGEDAGWSLTQRPDLSDCGRFTRYELGNGKIALETCHGRFVTAPRRGSTRLDWEVWQDSGLGDCAQFTLESYGDGVALKTCAGKYLTAGDGNWESPLQWSVVAETGVVNPWEKFTVLPQQR